MYPTKIYDQEQRQAEHVRRHLDVLNAAYGDPDISGAIGWCMFDYNTHKDFGSGDRICYHGVLDMFREPKFAAYVYASQCEPSDEIVMKPVTYWARGERNIGGVLHLPRPPVVFDHRHFTPDELGRWGLEWLDGEFVGYIDGQPVASLKFAADPLPAKLAIAADSTALKARERDSTRVVIRALDQVGQRLPFMNDAVTLHLRGPGRIVGPATVPLQGGTAGFWLEATGLTGEITVEAVSARFAPVSVVVAAV
jgi:beta-galactosidase